MDSLLLVEPVAPFDFSRIVLPPRCLALLRFRLARLLFRPPIGPFSALERILPQALWHPNFQVPLPFPSITFRSDPLKNKCNAPRTYYISVQPILVGWSLFFQNDNICTSVTSATLGTTRFIFVDSMEGFYSPPSYELTRLQCWTKLLRELCVHTLLCVSLIQSVSFYSQ